MNVQYRGILALIKSGITGEKNELPQGFALNESLEILKKHEIIPMVCEGAVCCGVPKEELSDLMNYYYRYTISSLRQLDVLQKIFDAFDENAIDYLPLKGSHLKFLYPKPEMRVMGDADILIHVEQYEKIRPIMTSLGFEEKYESDHELIWQNPSLMVELHKRVIPSYNTDYFRYFGNGWRLAIPKTATRYTMKPEDEFVYLFTHFSKHYRDGGIGCRHIVDLWVFQRAFPKLDWNYIFCELEKLSLAEFCKNILRLLDVWFHGRDCDEMTEFITEFIFSSGSFGLKENHIICAGVRNAAMAGSLSGGKRWAFLHALFPGQLAMANRYPILKKYPWMLPVFWPVKWVSALLFRRDHIKQQQEEIAAATDDKVESMLQALKYVGLEFRFEEQ